MSLSPGWRLGPHEIVAAIGAGGMGEVFRAHDTKLNRLTGSTLEPGVPVRLFPTRIYGGGVDNAQGRQYDVAPDGRFLINPVLSDATAAPITLLMNWNPEGKK